MRVQDDRSERRRLRYARRSQTHEQAALHDADAARHGNEHREERHAQVDDEQVGQRERLLEPTREHAERRGEENLRGEVAEDQLGQLVRPAERGKGAAHRGHQRLTRSRAAAMARLPGRDSTTASTTTTAIPISRRSRSAMPDESGVLDVQIERGGREDEQKHEQTAWMTLPVNESIAPDVTATAGPPPARGRTAQ